MYVGLSFKFTASRFVCKNANGVFALSDSVRYVCGHSQLCTFVGLRPRRMTTVVAMFSFATVVIVVRWTFVAGVEGRIKVRITSFKVT